MVNSGVRGRGCDAMWSNAAGLNVQLLLLGCNTYTEKGVCKSGNGLSMHTRLVKRNANDRIGSVEESRRWKAMRYGEFLSV